MNALLYRLKTNPRARRGAIVLSALALLAACAAIALLPSSSDAPRGDGNRRTGHWPISANNTTDHQDVRSPPQVAASADAARRAAPLEHHTTNDPAAAVGAGSGPEDQPPVPPARSTWGRWPMGTATPTPEQRQAAMEARELNRLHGPPAIPSSVTWAESHGVWMSVDGGWLHGFLSDDGRFFTTYRGNAPYTNGPPPAGARVISNVGQERLFLLQSATYFAQDGDVLTPGLSVVGRRTGESVHTFLVFEGAEVISYLRLEQGFFGPIRSQNRFFELTDEIEVVTIYRQ